MASCKACMHNVICDNVGCFDPTGNCTYFQDRSRFVELPQPVKPGDKLWYILDGLDAIDLRERKTTRGNSAVGDDPDIVFDVSTRGFWIVGVRRKDTEPISFNDCFLVPWDEFGKTYFLSREAAEQALKLKEREENAN